MKNILANKNIIILTLAAVIVIMVFSWIGSCNSNNKTKQHYENFIKI